MDFNEINKYFGEPLGNSPKPQLPFKFKVWHGVAVVIGGYLLYRGLVAIKDDISDLKGNKEKDDEL